MTTLTPFQQQIKDQLEATLRLFKHLHSIASDDKAVLVDEFGKKSDHMRGIDAGREIAYNIAIGEIESSLRQFDRAIVSEERLRERAAERYIIGRDAAKGAR